MAENLLEIAFVDKGGSPGGGTPPPSGGAGGNSQSGGDADGMMREWEANMAAALKRRVQMDRKTDAAKQAYDDKIAQDQSNYEAMMAASLKRTVQIGRKTMAAKQSHDDKIAEEEEKRMKADLAMQKRRADVLSSLARQRIKEEQATVNRRADDVWQQRSDWQKAQNDRFGGLQGIINRFLPGGGDVAGKFLGGSAKPPQFVGKDVLPAEGTQLARAVPGQAGAAAEGGLAGLSGAAMKFAGPIGIAIAAITLGSKAVSEGMKAYTDTIEYGAKQATAMIRNSHYEMLDNAMDHTAKTMEKLPIVGGAVADTFRATVAPVRAFHDMMTAAVARGKELERFNGNLAATNARAEVRGMQGDLREAQVTGANLARITDAQSRFDDTLREMLLPIKNILYGAIAHDMEMIADYGEQTMGYLKEVIAQLMITTEINEARRRVEERFNGGGAIDALPIDSLRQMLMTKLTGGGAPGGGASFDPVKMALMMPPVGGGP